MLRGEAAIHRSNRPRLRGLEETEYCTRPESPLESRPLHHCANFIVLHHQTGFKCVSRERQKVGGQARAQGGLTPDFLALSGMNERDLIDAAAQRQGDSNGANADHAKAIELRPGAFQ